MAEMKTLRDSFQAHLDKFGILDTKNRELLIDQTNEATIEESK